MNKVVLVFGGLGNAKSSVVGLYESLLHTLSSRFDIVAIDPAVQHPKSFVSQFQFPYSACYANLNALYRLTHILMLLRPSFSRQLAHISPSLNK